MQISRIKFRNYLLIVVLFISFLAVTSCNNSNNANTNGNQNTADNSTADNPKAPKDNVEELSNLIRLPETPEEAVWREDETESPKGKKLTAVLKYTDETAGKLVALVEKTKPGTQVQVGAEEWFPEELTAQTQLSGNESLKGTTYAANDFYNPPYQNGRLVRIQDTNYFILELTTY